ncbi:MAG: hypothetical protein E6L05_06510 [Thaumarchaeota archaeon]|nr:MAG: hypothetical protein E6L05_06510 [Nitrososphaerota archaeon]
MTTRIEPITNNFIILRSIFFLVSSRTFPNQEILAIGFHNHRVANEAPTTKTCPTNTGNLTIVSGIEVSW